MSFEDFPGQYCFSWIFNQPILNDARGDNDPGQIPVGSSQETLGGVFTRLISRNTTIPTKKSQARLWNDMHFFGAVALEIDMLYRCYRSLSNHDKLAISGKVCHVCFFHVKLDACSDAILDGQIIATENTTDFPQKCSWGRESPENFREIYRLVKYQMWISDEGIPLIGLKTGTGQSSLEGGGPMGRELGEISKFGQILYRICIN